MNPYFLSVFMGTFFLEDIAMATSLAMVADGRLTPELAFLANFLGIGLGDLLLYLMGRLARSLSSGKVNWISMRVKRMLSKSPSTSSFSASIFASRFLPGFRLPTHLAAGFYRYSMPGFIILTLISVLIWVLLALTLGRTLFLDLKMNPLFATVYFLIALRIVSSSIKAFKNKWLRKHLKFSYKKWLYFEFWPAWLFYLPMIPIYLFLSIRYRSLIAPFLARPESKNGGMVGESKWDFLSHLSSGAPYALKAILIQPQTPWADVQQALSLAALNFPLVAKPDVGQRGFGVRFLQNEAELLEYLKHSRFAVILQQRSRFNREAGIFYVRHPGRKSGDIISITDKEFPVVTGDGISKLGDLILRDTRAQVIAPTYFQRFESQLDDVIGKEHVIRLVECGNHAQGAIFINGKSLNSEDLRTKIDEIAKGIPSFYFGRFDVRYESSELLKTGQNFEIVEVNGASAEATHIWDRQTTLWDAYKSLFHQWDLLFLVGKEVQCLSGQPASFSVISFFKDWIGLLFRDNYWRISS